MPTRICFIRHGETDWNASKRIQGQIDIPLNEAGRAQAQAMAVNAAQYEFSAIYSSDLGRAHATAQMMAGRRGLEVSMLPQLRERHYGIFQGITAEEGASAILRRTRITWHAIPITILKRAKACCVLRSG